MHGKDIQLVTNQTFKLKKDEEQTMASNQPTTKIILKI